MSVLLETTVGDMVVDLYCDKRPRTCLNFLKLCKLKFYNFCVFHSIEPNFIAQTGDPSGMGTGGESVFRILYGDQARFFEMEHVPKLAHTKPGTLSMVNNGDDFHGSQFFITLSGSLDYLDGKHTVFGEVAEGDETLAKLNDAICDEKHRPYKDIWISHTHVLHDPYEDPHGLEYPSRSPSPTLDLIKSSRLAPHEQLDDDKGVPDDVIQERMEAKEAKARAHVLEMIGDLHHADEKPPDNVLFVCKLNSVTTDEDLQIIFSRFGPIKDVEVIRDHKTGNSLQYAFVEFEDEKHCENAYFKMDNVLIDDRRIHVDFSQSVSKNYQWKRQVVKEAGPSVRNVAEGKTDRKMQRLQSDDADVPVKRRRQESPKRHSSSSIGNRTDDKSSNRVRGKRRNSNSQSPHVKQRRRSFSGEGDSIGQSSSTGQHSKVEKPGAGTYGTKKKQDRDRVVHHGDEESYSRRGYSRDEHSSRRRSGRGQEDYPGAAERTNTGGAKGTDNCQKKRQGSRHDEQRNKYSSDTRASAYDAVGKVKEPSGEPCRMKESGDSRARIGVQREDERRSIQKTDRDEKIANKRRGGYHSDLSLAVNPTGGRMSARSRTDSESVDSDSSASGSVSDDAVQEEPRRTQKQKKLHKKDKKKKKKKKQKKKGKHKNKKRHHSEDESDNGMSKKRKQDRHM